MTSLVSLWAALNKATPGPWEARDDDAELLVTDTNGMDICRVDYAPFEDGRHEDAALIVAAVNALPALLDIAQAAQAFLEVNSVIGGGRQVEPAYQALREALAALEEQT